MYAGYLQPQAAQQRFVVRALYTSLITRRADLSTAVASLQSLKTIVRLRDSLRNARWSVHQTIGTSHQAPGAVGEEQEQMQRALPPPVTHYGQDLSAERMSLARGDDRLGNIFEVGSVAGIPSALA